MDVFIFLIYRESFGLVVVEVFVCGIFVLVFNISLVNDIVIYGKNGLFFNVKDKNFIVDIIVELLEMVF